MPALKKMTDIKQKAREVAEELLPYLENGVRPNVVSVIAAAIQSTIDDEREECAKEIERQMEHSPKHDREVLAAAIRARGQKVLDNNTKVR